MTSVKCLTHASDVRDVRDVREVEVISDLRDASISIENHLCIAMSLMSFSWKFHALQDVEVTEITGSRVKMD